MAQNKEVYLNNFDIKYFNIKPLTEADINKQKDSTQYVTWVNYNNQPLTFKLKEDLKLFAYSGIPTYSESIHKGGILDTGRYRLNILIDETQPIYQLIKEKFEQIDKYCLENVKNIIPKSLKPSKYSYINCYKVPEENNDDEEEENNEEEKNNKKENEKKENEKSKYNKIVLKIPIDTTKNNQISDKFEVFLYNKNTINGKRQIQKVIGIKTITDLEQYIRRGAVIRPYIKFNKVWIQKSAVGKQLPQWGITLVCNKLFIIDKGNDNSDVKFEEDDDFIVDNNNTINTDTDDDKNSNKLKINKSSKSKDKSKDKSNDEVNITNVDIKEDDDEDNQTENNDDNQDNNQDENNDKEQAQDQEQEQEEQKPKKDKSKSKKSKSKKTEDDDDLESDEDKEL